MFASKLSLRACMAVVLVLGSALTVSGEIKVRRTDVITPPPGIDPTWNNQEAFILGDDVYIREPSGNVGTIYWVWESEGGDIGTIATLIENSNYFDRSFEVQIRDSRDSVPHGTPGARDIEAILLDPSTVHATRLRESWITGSLNSGVRVKKPTQAPNLDYGTVTVHIGGDLGGTSSVNNVRTVGFDIDGDLTGTIEITSTQGFAPEPLELVSVDGNMAGTARILVHGPLTMDDASPFAIRIGDAATDSFEGEIKLYQGLDDVIEINATNSGEIQAMSSTGVRQDITGDIVLNGPTDGDCTITAANLDGGSITQIDDDLHVNDFKGTIDLSGDLLSDASIELPGLIYGADITVDGNFSSGRINISRDALDGLIDVAGAWSGHLSCFDGIDTGTVTAASMTSTGLISCQDDLSVQPIMDGTIEIAGEMAGEIDLAYGVGDDAEVTLGSVGEAGLIWMENWLNTTDLYDMEGTLLVEGDFKGELKLDRISGTVEIEQSLWADPTFPDTTYGSIRFSNLQGDVLINTTCQTLGSYPTNYPWQGKIYHDGAELDRNYYTSDPEIGDLTTGGSITPHMIDLPCRGDLNGDDAINQQDLGILLAHFEIAGDCRGDLNQDGETDQSDLGILLAVFDTTCN